MRFWNGPQLLICDELGYLPLPAEAPSHFFQVVSRRYKHGSIILTTNRGIAQWGEIFDDPTVAAAILDRLLDRGIVLTINGPLLPDAPPPRTTRRPPRRPPSRPSRQVEGRADHSQARRTALSASIRIDCGRKRPDRPRRRQTHRPKPSPLKAQKRAVGLLV
jgi:IstB-like ATP binding protein